MDTALYGMLSRITNNNIPPVASTTDASGTSRNLSSYSDVLLKSLSAPNFPTYARLAAGFPSSVKRPLQADDGNVSFPGASFGVGEDGSPPKRLSYGLDFFRDRTASVQQTMPYPMAVQEDGTETDSEISSAGTISVNSNGYGTSHQNGLSSGWELGGNLPNTFVVLYGCSGYGELAIKMNSATSSVLHGGGPGAVTVNGGGGGVQVDNLALQLWDEEAETVLLAWAVVDAKLNKVVAVEERVLRSWDELNRDCKLLQEPFKLESGVDADKIKNSPFKLDQVLQQIDETVRIRGGGSLVLVTLGPELLRQQLLPECARRGILLSDYFFTYVDLFSNMKDAWSLNGPSVSKRLADLLENNRLVADVSAEYGKRHVMDMAKLVQLMIHNGHKFSEAQRIVQRYEPGLSKSEEISDDAVVRARGLPWQASDMDVARFFYGLDIPRGGIALCLSSHGRRNGEAIVLFANSQQRDLALQRHKHHMTNRYIEVYRALAEDFQQVAGVCNTEAEKFLRRKGNVIIRMRGLPYESTAKDVVEFFACGEKVVNVVDGEDGVLFVKRSDGRAAGDAFVLLNSEEDGQKALGKHRERIGLRYIELFRSTTAEVQQVLNKSHDIRSENQAPLISTPPNVAGLMNPFSQGLLMQSPLMGGMRNCIRLRGLPFEATVEDILDFLGDKAKHIVVQGVHMVYNAQGQPSGEAFIQMDSEVAANLTCQERHNRFMNMSKYGKKNRYIEVYQCSAEEMNGNGMGGLGLQGVRPLLPHGLAGLAPFQPNFNPFNPSLSLMMSQMSQLSPALRPQLPGLYSLPYWPYPSPPLSPTNTFPANSVMSGLTNGHLSGLSLPNGLSFVLLRNLPYTITANDIATFLQGVTQISPESVQLVRLSDGRLNGEAFVVFASRDEAERAIHERNRQILGNRRVDMSIMV